MTTSHFLANSLCSLLRDGHEEIRVFGEIVVHDGDAMVWHTGPSVGRYPARSLLKPFQFLSAELPVESWSRGDEALRYVPCLGSVSATPEQVTQLTRWHQGSRLVDKLQLPPSYPMDELHRAQLKLAGQGPQRIFHTCFSKHLAIVESCEQAGWDTADYLKSTHPFHSRLLMLLREVTGEKLPEVEWVTDGCLLPSPVLSVATLARLYARLAFAPASTRLGAIRDRMLAHPFWIGGPGRVDTKLMEANPGRVVAKEGADGLWGVAVMPNERFRQGLGIVLKLASGYHPPLAALALGKLMESIGLESIGETPRGQKTVYHYSLDLA